MSSCIVITPATRQNAGFFIGFIQQVSAQTQSVASKYFLNICYWCFLHVSNSDIVLAKAKSGKCHFAINNYAWGGKSDRHKNVEHEIPTFLADCYKKLFYSVFVL